MTSPCHTNDDFNEYDLSRSQMSEMKFNGNDDKEDVEGSVSSIRGASVSVCLFRYK